MIRSGILNPHLSALLCRFRHTNTLVIADRGFPSWAALEIVDLSLVDGIPKVEDVLRAVLGECIVGRAWMAEEFLTSNEPVFGNRVQEILGPIPLEFEPHGSFKDRVARSIGLIRTGETLQYSNIILESA